MLFSLKNVLELTSFIQLLKYGLHIGHSLKNTLFMNSWLVYKIKINLIILNLFKFLFHFRIGFELISFTAHFLNPVWFVNLNPFYDKIVKFYALKCGEFFVCSNWIRGMVSNFRFVSTSYRKMQFYSTIVFTRKDFLKQINFNNWGLTRFSWPRCVFSSSVHNSYLAVKEALSLGIPGIGIVDSNTFTQTVAIGIPGNDETMECIMFYNDLVATTVLRKKFKSVILWYLNVRRSFRLKKFALKLRKNLNAFFKFLRNDNIYFERGFDFYYAWGSKFPENVNDNLFIYYSKDLLFDVDWSFFENYIKQKLVFWRSFSFVSHFWSGGRNFFQLKYKFITEYMLTGITIDSNTIDYNRHTYYFRYSLTKPRSRFFLIHNRYWTSQGSSHQRLPYFPSNNYLDKFFMRKGLYWSLYMYFLLSEGLSLFVIDSKFFRLRLWSDFLSKLFLLNSLSSILHFPVSSIFFKKRQGILSLIANTFKEKEKSKYIYLMLLKLLEFIKNNFNEDSLYLNSLSLFFYNIWKNYKKIFFYKKLDYYYCTIKRTFAYYNYNYNYKLWSNNNLSYSNNNLQKILNVLIFTFMKYFLKLKSIFKKYITIKDQIKDDNIKNVIFFNIYDIFIKILILKNQFNINYKNSQFFVLSYLKMRQSLLLKHKGFLLFLNKDIFWNRIKAQINKAKKITKYKYRFFLGRFFFSFRLDRKFLRNFANWAIRKKNKSFFFSKLLKKITFK